MADYEVSKIMWVAIVVALAASIFVIAKPQINTLAHSTFGKISSVTSGIRVSEIKHTAYANNAEGTDGFSTTKPNLNLSDGTKDFSGGWWFVEDWENDGTYKGLTVKKKAIPWGAISKPFTAPKDGVYTFSAYVKGSGNPANVIRYTTINGAPDTEKAPNKSLGNNFDWLRDSFTVTLKAKDIVATGYNLIGSDTGSIIWTAGHKWEPGSTATPYMPSESEAKPSDQPKYIGTYTDHSETASQEPKHYTWKLNPDYH